MVCNLNVYIQLCSYLSVDYEINLVNSLLNYIFDFDFQQKKTKNILVHYYWYIKNDYH